MLDCLHPGIHRADICAAAGLTIGGLALYLATLAPTVLWGDDATLQLSAVDGAIRASAGSHPLWVLAAHALTALPIGELAYRVNLLSALAGALTLGMLYLAMRLLGISRQAGIPATIAFAVSHTFWAHAVRAEVYTLSLATMGLMVVAGLLWRRTGRDRYLILLGVSTGLALVAHLLAVLYLPALAWLLYSHRSLLRRRSLVRLGLSLVLALSPLVYLLWRDAREMQWNLITTLRWASLTFEGYDFGSSMFSLSFASLPSDLAQWILFLGYQFVGLALPLGVAGAVLSWRRVGRENALFLLMLYLAPAVFAFSYQVGDRYVFFLPSYFAFCLWLGGGIDAVLMDARAGRLGATCRTLLSVGILVLVIAVPVITYRLTPDVMAHFGWHFREGRRVPGPNGRYYVLWPPKAGYTDARDYAEAALASAPDGALVLADPILAAPMFFLQRTENVRPDIAIRYCCWDIDSVLAANPGREIVLADATPAIYPMARLRLQYQIVAVPPIYILMPFDK